MTSDRSDFPSTCSQFETIDACAAAANWESAEATRSIADLTQFVLSVEVLGGLAALVAAIFAGLAFRETRKSARAAGKQAEESEKAAKIAADALVHTQSEDSQRRALDIARSGGIAHCTSIVAIWKGRWPDCYLRLDIANVGKISVHMQGIAATLDVGNGQTMFSVESDEFLQRSRDIDPQDKSSMDFLLKGSSGLADLNPTQVAIAISGSFTLNWTDALGYHWYREMEVRGVLTGAYGSSVLGFKEGPVLLARSHDILRPEDGYAE